jgi:hypothetical protein
LEDNLREGSFGGQFWRPVLEDNLREASFGGQFQRII